MATNKIKVNKTKIIVTSVFLTTVLVSLYLCLGIYRISSNKMLPAFKNGSVVLIKKTWLNEKFKDGDVLIYKSYLHNELGIGRVVSANSIRSYVSSDKYNNASGTTDVGFVMPLNCPESPKINVEVDYGNKCYTNTNLNELQIMGVPVMADSIAENTWKRRFIIESPSRSDIKGRVLACLLNCR